MTLFLYTFMHLISFDASNRQINKLKKGLPTRIKRGRGFNLIVSPGNYNLVSRAFTKNKGVELKLSPEELHFNSEVSPEEHEELSESIDNNLFEALPFAEGGSIFKKIKKALRSKTAKRVGRDMKPLSRELKQIGREVAHEKLAEAHMDMADRYGDNQYNARAINALSNYGHSRIGGNGLYAGAGLYAGRGMNVHDALKLANLATANANHQLAKIHNSSVHGMMVQPPIRNYYNSDLEPPSRGTGIHSHLNVIRGRGSLLNKDNMLPPALQSQPYGANFHMQFFLPPEYKKFNDGTDMEGRGFHF